MPSTRRDDAAAASNEARARALDKCPTGIIGLDEILEGGLPAGRPTLVCGGAGSGKTLLAAEFLVRGATQFDEPGVFMAFEETASDLAQNFWSLGVDLHALVEQQKLLIDYVRVERDEIEETGEYDLEALFIRLSDAVSSIGAKRVVLDTVESLFSGLSNAAVLRAELRRMFRWIKENQLTGIVTGERGTGSLTREGLEEYISDCVILLDHRVREEIATRRLRVVKYRGSRHGTNEYPFLIGEHGMEVVPITSINMNQEVSSERTSTGIAELDRMLEGGGYYRGSTVLISGSAGTGKTSVAAHLVNAACRRGERALFCTLEESPNQVIRNMRSIGIDLAPWVNRGLLLFSAARPVHFGLEMHLVTLHKQVREFEPRVVVIDPLSSFLTLGSDQDLKAMIIRLTDFLKARLITTLVTLLTGDGGATETHVGVSSLADTWIIVEDHTAQGKRGRTLCVLKSRGMSHSTRCVPLRFTKRGIELRGKQTAKSLRKS